MNNNTGNSKSMSQAKNGVTKSYAKMNKIMLSQPSEKYAKQLVNEMALNTSTIKEQMNGNGHINYQTNETNRSYNSQKNNTYNGISLTNCFAYFSEG